MSKRVKEEERIESIIRNLLKLQENRRCINCNSLGPQYVCTTFWTFVCTNCSGVHREFTHRVKSVSMAKFNAEEVSALQAGGNERARQIYFKDWDPQRHSLPDGSNQNRLRDFIKHVYVDRKFTGERSMGKLAMVKTGAKEDSSERLSIERLSPGGRMDDRSSKYYIEERRSPRYKPDNVRSSGRRNRPVHFEIVDDRFRDDGFGSGRRPETNRPSNAEPGAGSRPPYSQKSRQTTSPPEVRPVGDILGENVLPLQVGESPKAIDRRDNDSSALGQKTAALSNPDSCSLIDFSVDPEPPDPALELQTQQSALSIYGGNGASVQSSMKAKASDAPNVNSLESILFELSGPAAGPVDIMSEAPGNADAPSAATVSASTTYTPAAPSTGDAPVGMAPMLPSSSIDACAYLQSWTSSIAPNPQGSSNASAEESSQPSSKVVKDTSGVGSPALPVEVKSCGRKELSADFFTSSYSSYPAPVPSWQIRVPHGMGYSMQYHPSAVPMPAFPNSEKSRNPFDLDNDSTQAQVLMFPSMLPVQGALPNSSAPTALLHTSDTRPSQIMRPQASSYASMAPPQLTSYGMSVAPGAFMGQQLPNNMPFSRPISGGDAFASLNPIQQPGSRYPAANTTNSFSPAGGNPFG